MISWICHGQDVIGPFPSGFHAVEWARRWLPGVEVQVTENVEPGGYRYSVKESEVYLRSVGANP